MNAFLVSAAVLGLVVAGGIVAITMIRRRMRGVDDQATWEKTLTDYRNLRDEGVLSEEEYRKIRTLVEPRMRVGDAAPDGRQRPAVDVAGPDHGRN
ncbi:MAG: hypothetical protein ACKO4T_12505 [Planctomycetaceae bacterium]